MVMPDGQCPAGAAQCLDLLQGHMAWRVRMLDRRQLDLAAAKCAGILAQRGDNGGGKLSSL